MDAFKLLTRSAKVKGNQISDRKSNLPSAGAAETPQLFTADESLKLEKGNAPGKKRKRDAGEGDAENENFDVDFFGAMDLNRRHDDEPNGQVGDTKTREALRQEGKSDGQDANDADATMPEEERKVILNSHKIKVSNLSITPSQISTAETKLRDKKKDKKEKKRKRKGLEENSAALTKKQLKKAQLVYPQPLLSFSQLSTRYNISRRLAQNISKQGYSTPTEVQLGSLPLLLGDYPQPSNTTEPVDGSSVTHVSKPETEPDLLVIAPTGSGKTLAFMIPLITKILKYRHAKPGERGVFGIVLAPTKELAFQITNEARKLTLGTGVKVTAMKKGMRIVDVDGDTANSGSESESSDEEENTDEEDEDSASGSNVAGGQEKRTIPRATVTKSDIIVATPLNLVNSLTGNKKHPAAQLPTVQSLVLDEADVLLDPLFRDQTLEVWSACTNATLRVGLWSATMGSNIEELTKSMINERRSSLKLKDYEGQAALLRLVVGLKDSAVPNVTHKLVYAATERGKLLGLRQIIRPHSIVSTPDTERLRPPFLIFTQTIARAVALHSELKYDVPPEAGGSSRIAVLHSELSDFQRSKIMTKFRQGEIWILVTTDLLARGVDFRGINGVVNYDIPNSSAAYVHRVGRTGRAGRKGGIAVTFYTKDDIAYVKAIANAIAASEKLRGVAQGEGMQKWLLDVLPDLTKKDKQEMKRGVAVRRPKKRLAESPGPKKQKQKQTRDE